MAETDDPPDFPGAVGRLVREALADWRLDPGRADFKLEYACTQLPDPLPLYRVLYKFYNRQRRFDRARDFAGRALAESVRQGGLEGGPDTWTAADLEGLGTRLASQLLLALKAQAFLALRTGDEAGAAAPLAALRRLDPEDGSGVSVVEALAAG